MFLKDYMNESVQNTNGYSLPKELKSAKEIRAKGPI